MATIRPSRRWCTYKDIRSHCYYAGMEHSRDYTMRREYWRCGDLVYTVLIKVNPLRDRVLRITGRIQRREPGAWLQSTPC